MAKASLSASSSFVSLSLSSSLSSKLGVFGTTACPLLPCPKINFQQECQDYYCHHRHYHWRSHSSQEELVYHENFRREVHMGTLWHWKYRSVQLHPQSYLQGSNVIIREVFLLEVFQKNIHPEDYIGGLKRLLQMFYIYQWYYVVHPIYVPE